MGLKSWGVLAALAALVSALLGGPSPAIAQRQLPAIARVVDETGTLSPGQRVVVPAT